MKALRKLPRTVWLLGFVSLCNDAASEMVYPLIPLYLASVLMAGPKVLGLIEGIAEACSSLMKLLSGYLSDRMQRQKAWILSGYGLAALVRPLYVLVVGWLGVLLLRFLDRIGKGLRSAPRDAMLSHAVSIEQRGMAFGFHRAMDNLGAVLGPLMASLLLAKGLALPHLFWLAGFLGVLAVLMAAFVRDPELPGVKRKALDLQRPLQHRPLRRFLWVLGLFTLGNSSNMFLLLRAKELDLSDSQIPLLWAAVAAIAALGSTPLSALSDRIGRKSLMVSGWLIYAALYFWMASGKLQGSGIWVWFSMFGAYQAATEGVEKAMVADLSPAELRGSAFGWYYLISGAALLPASLMFGWFYQSIGPQWAFSCGAGLALLATVLLVVWVPVPKPSQP